MDMQAINNLTNAGASTLAAMLTPALAYLAVGALMLTQAIKVVAIYARRALPAPLIWFVVSPAAASALALGIWTDAAVHWLAAALAASLAANIFYAIFLKRLLGRAAPEVYQRINAPLNRRKRVRR